MPVPTTTTCRSDYGYLLYFASHSVTRCMTAKSPPAGAVVFLMV